MQTVPKVLIIQISEYGSHAYLGLLASAPAMLFSATDSEAMCSTFYKA